MRRRTATTPAPTTSPSTQPPPAGPMSAAIIWRPSRTRTCRRRSKLASRAASTIPSCLARQLTATWARRTSTCTTGLSPERASCTTASPSRQTSTTPPAWAPTACSPTSRLGARVTARTAMRRRTATTPAPTTSPSTQPPPAGPMSAAIIWRPSRTRTCRRRSKLASRAASTIPSCLARQLTATCTTSASTTPGLPGSASCPTASPSRQSATRRAVGNSTSSFRRQAGRQRRRSIKHGFPASKLAYVRSLTSC
mmetsp:Transcript_41911/g.135523  ORF Transcript_41911/g.135523 Transcript_41911/m.135523 type:complete len:253 (+) Transcript_41911:385-1143(+)